MTGENARLKDAPVSAASGNSCPKPRVQPKETYPEVALVDAVCTYVSYGLLIIWGYFSDFLRSVGIKNDMKFSLKPKDVSYIFNVSVSTVVLKYESIVCFIHGR